MFYTIPGTHEVIDLEQVGLGFDPDCFDPNWDNIGNSSWALDRIIEANERAEEEHR
jgi:hypothetical protein